MRLNVAALLKEATGARREYALEEAGWEDPDADAQLLEPVKGLVRLTRTNRGVFVELTASTAVASVCSRCLEPSRHEVEVDFRDEYFPTIDISTGRLNSDDAVNDAMEGSLLIDQYHVIDLWEALRQCILVQMPLQPLCATECKGICPDCGVNLNSAECRCVQRAVDERLTGLESWLQAEKAKQ